MTTMKLHSVVVNGTPMQMKINHDEPLSVVITSALTLVGVPNIEDISRWILQDESGAVLNSEKTPSALRLHGMIFLSREAGIAA